MNKVPDGPDSVPDKVEGGKNGGLVQEPASSCQGTGGLVSNGSPSSGSLGHQPMNTMRAEVREQVPGCGWRTVAGAHHPESGQVKQC